MKQLSITVDHGTLYGSLDFHVVTTLGEGEGRGGEGYNTMCTRTEQAAPM